MFASLAVITHSEPFLWLLQLGASYSATDQSQAPPSRTGQPLCLLAIVFVSLFEERQDIGKSRWLLELLLLPPMATATQCDCQSIQAAQSRLVGRLKRVEGVQPINLFALPAVSFSPFCNSSNRFDLLRTAVAVAVALRQPQRKMKTTVAFCLLFSSLLWAPLSPLVVASFGCNKHASQSIFSIDDLQNSIRSVLWRCMLSLSKSLRWSKSTKLALSVAAMYCPLVKCSWWYLQCSGVLISNTAAFFCSASFGCCCWWAASFRANKLN